MSGVYLEECLSGVYAYEVWLEQGEVMPKIVQVEGFTYYGNEGRSVEILIEDLPEFSWAQCARFLIDSLEEVTDHCCTDGKLKSNFVKIRFRLTETGPAVEEALLWQLLFRESPSAAVDMVGSYLQAIVKLLESKEELHWLMLSCTDGEAALDGLDSDVMPIGLHAFVACIDYHRFGYPHPRPFSSSFFDTCCIFVDYLGHCDFDQASRIDHYIMQTLTMLKMSDRSEAYRKLLSLRMLHGHNTMETRSYDELVEHMTDGGFKYLVMHMQRYDYLRDERGACEMIERVCAALYGYDEDATIKTIQKIRKITGKGFERFLLSDPDDEPLRAESNSKRIGYGFPDCYDNGFLVYSRKNDQWTDVEETV